MSLVCTKALRLNSIPYYPGDMIPDSAVLPDRARALKKSGYIAEVVADPDAVGTAEVREGVLEASFEGKVVVPVMLKDGDTAETMAVPLTEDEVQTVFSILQSNVDQATETIEKETRENVLIVVHAADNRTGVKKAAKKRADTLSSTGGEKNDASNSNETTEGENKPDSDEAQSE